MSKSKRENFYRRDPGAALAGMAGMSLEDRGVYNTIIDLLYLTWRPLEDNPKYIAGHCGCAVQKLNPILQKLIDCGKLIRFEEGGQRYISNPAFDRERTEVKGVGTRSGRAKVEEKSQGVEEKSASVEKNPPSCSDEVELNQGVESLEKSRVDKRRETPLPPSGGEGSLFELQPNEEPPDEVEVAFESWNKTAAACGLAKAKDLTTARRRLIRKRLDDAGLPGWREALDGVQLSRHCRGENDRRWKADLDFVCQPKSFQRLRERFYGDDAPPPTNVVQVAPPTADELWRGRVCKFKTGSGYWDDIEWGPRPGRDGCRAPAAVISEFCAVSERATG